MRVQCIEGGGRGRRGQLAYIISALRGVGGNWRTSSMHWGCTVHWGDIISALGDIMICAYPHRERFYDSHVINILRHDDKTLWGNKYPIG